jgi:glycosyltransferase involved in cell wall biosynthesis
VASLLLRLPASLRAPVVYEAHGIAADAAAARGELLSGGAGASPSKIRRLTNQDAHVWRAADGYVTITTGLKNELERRFGVRRHVAVVPDGVRAAEERAADKETETKDAEKMAADAADDTDAANDTDGAGAAAGRPFTIGYAGHLYPWKGVDLVIEAVAGLQDIRALIVGGHEQEPDLARVRALAEERFCSQRVTFTGMVPPPDVAARLRQADVLVLPNPPSTLSREFTSPLKLFEYMASGRPIVASDLPSLREVLTDGRNALLFAPADPQALTAAIRRIMDDRALGSRLAEQARRDVAGYTWATRAARLEALFDEVRSQ